MLRSTKIPTSLKQKDNHHRQNTNKENQKQGSKWFLEAGRTKETHLHNQKFSSPNYTRQAIKQKSQSRKNSKIKSIFPRNLPKDYLK